MHTQRVLPIAFFFWSHVTWSVHTCRRRWPTPQLKKKIEKKAPENNSTPCRYLSSPPALGAQRHAHSHLDKEVHFPCFNFKIIRDIRFTYRKIFCLPTCANVANCWEKVTRTKQDVSELVFFYNLLWKKQVRFMNFYLLRHLGMF